MGQNKTWIAFANEKKLYTLLCVMIIVLFTSSCSVLYNSSIDISSKQTYLDVKIFQTLNKYEALAITSDNKFNVVKVITSEDVYYDGKELSGQYILVDTYTYETKDERIKTVPVYRRESELKKK